MAQNTFLLLSAYGPKALPCVTQGGDVHLPFAPEEACLYIQYLKKKMPYNTANQNEVNIHAVHILNLHASYFNAEKIPLGIFLITHTNFISLHRY